MLIAVANLIISSSNFLFPTESVRLNNTAFEVSIVRNLDRLPQGVGALLPQLPAAVREEFRRGGATAFFDNCDRLAERNQSSTACAAVEVTLLVSSQLTLTFGSCSVFFFAKTPLRPATLKTFAF